MPPSSVLPYTDPRITLDIRTPVDQTAILPLSFTGAIIDGLQYLLVHVIDLGHNVPIPAEGAFSLSAGCQSSQLALTYMAGINWIA